MTAPDSKEVLDPFAVKTVAATAKIPHNILRIMFIKGAWSEKHHFIVEYKGAALQFYSANLAEGYTPEAIEETVKNMERTISLYEGMRSLTYHQNFYTETMDEFTLDMLEALYEEALHNDNIRDNWFRRETGKFLEEIIEEEGGEMPFEDFYRRAMTFRASRNFEDKTW